MDKPSRNGSFLPFCFQSIMKGIVKRYLFKLQRDKENDDVNEGRFGPTFCFLFVVSKCSELYDQKIFVSLALVCL